MNLVIGYSNLPKDIKVHLSRTNLFYSECYENNVKIRNQEMYYVWSDTYVMAVRVKKQFFLKAAVLESEPYKYAEGETEKDFLNAAMHELKRSGVQWTVCATTARFQNYPQGSVVAPCGNYIVDLTLSEEELWKNVHSKHRNSIRRGEKSGIDIRIGGMELLKKYVEMSIETYLRSYKNTEGYDYYEGIMKGLKDNIVLFVAEKDGVPQSGGMFYYNDLISYYLHGASISRPEPGATNFLLWRAMMYFKDKGVREFSFVGYHYDPEPGSKLDGIQKFKGRFGGMLEKSYNFRYVQSPIAYKIYCFAMQLKKRKPFQKYQDAIDLQVAKYPELNGGE